MMQGRRVLDQALTHSIEETGSSDVALPVTRLSELAQSNAFLWMKAGLSVQEHANRLVASAIRESLLQERKYF